MEGIRMSLGGFSFGYQPTSGCDGGASISANSAKAAARSAQSDVQMMAGEIERLLMITEALWSFLKKEHGYSDEDLIKKVAEIDLQDGKLDGRVKREPAEIQTCPTCERAVGRKRPICLYCGAAIVRDPFER